MIDYELLAINPGYAGRFFEAEAAITAKIASVSLEALMTSQDGDEEQSPLLQVENDVGLVTVKGTLTDRYSVYNRFFGMVSYDEIMQATHQAVDAGVGAIMYLYDTPGGKVSGMAAAAEEISSLETPTITFTSSSMASAGYFLGIQSDEVYADSFAEVGSVGIVMKTYDRSQYLAEIGVKPIRFRSGKLKAVGDQDFKMTSQEEKYLQKKVDTFAMKFFNIVSEARGLPLPVLKKNGVTSGRTFIGEEALQAQLVDGMKTFDESMWSAYVAAKKTVDKRNKAGLSYKY